MFGNNILPILEALTSHMWRKLSILNSVFELDPGHEHLEVIIVSATSLELSPGCWGNCHVFSAEGVVAGLTFSHVFTPPQFPALAWVIAVVH